MLRLEDKRIRLKDPEIPGCDNYIQGMGVAGFLPQDAFPQQLQSQGHPPLVFLPQGHHMNHMNASFLSSTSHTSHLYLSIFGNSKAKVYSLRLGKAER